MTISVDEIVKSPEGTYRSYFEVLEPLLKSKRQLILDNFGKVAHESKKDLTVVTEIDREIERFYRDVLTHKYPDIGFDGEEFGKTEDTKKYWLIDTIDGTENFIRGIDGVGSMIAQVEDGEVKLASIYYPINENFYWTIRCEGA